MRTITRVSGLIALIVVVGGGTWLFAQAQKLRALLSAEDTWRSCSSTATRPMTSIPDRSGAQRGPLPTTAWRISAGG